VLRELRAGAVADLAPAELCELYPDACARLRGEPEATLAQLFSMPTAEGLEAAYRRGTVGELERGARQLSDWDELIRSFQAREAEHVRRGAPAVTIEEYLSDVARDIGREIARSDELWERIDAYGRSIVDRWSGASVGEAEDEISADIRAILWEERCKRENAMFAQMPAMDAFWFHLSRVMTRHVYDDSYWIPADELSAWTRGDDLHLAP
jgi:hypothetical protein